MIFFYEKPDPFTHTCMTTEDANFKTVQKYLHVPKVKTLPLPLPSTYLPPKTCVDERIWFYLQQGFILQGLGALEQHFVTGFHLTVPLGPWKRHGWGQQSHLLIHPVGQNGILPKKRGEERSYMCTFSTNRNLGFSVKEETQLDKLSVPKEIKILAS